MPGERHGEIAGSHEAGHRRVGPPRSGLHRAPRRGQPEARRRCPRTRAACSAARAASSPPRRRTAPGPAPPAPPSTGSSRGPPPVARTRWVARSINPVHRIWLAERREDAAAPPGERGPQPRRPRARPPRSAGTGWHVRNHVQEAHGDRGHARRRGRTDAHPVRDPTPEQLLARHGDNSDKTSSPPRIGRRGTLVRRRGRSRERRGCAARAPRTPGCRRTARSPSRRRSEHADRTGHVRAAATGAGTFDHRRIDASPSTPSNGGIVAQTSRPRYGHEPPRRASSATSPARRTSAICVLLGREEPGLDGDLRGERRHDSDR